MVPELKMFALKLALVLVVVGLISSAVEFKSNCFTHGIRVWEPEEGSKYSHKVETVDISCRTHLRLKSEVRYFF